MGRNVSFHTFSTLTTFRGRPEDRLRDLLLRGDAALRMALRKLFPGGVRKVTHQYRR